MNYFKALIAGEKAISSTEVMHRYQISSTTSISRSKAALIKNDILDEVLEQKYQEASDEFIGLVDSFARKESDEKIRELVYQIYRVASGYPKPERWINEA